MYNIEKFWECEGLKCVVIAVDRGHRCGYVGVDITHPLYQFGYSSTIPPELIEKWRKKKETELVGKRGIIDLFCYDDENPRVGIIFDVHGGITYADGGKKSKYPLNSDLWWFGFDCAHAGDGKDITIMSAKQLEWETEFNTKYGYRWNQFDGIPRTLEYCVEECESLAKQLREVER
jgi:hypothetical protein